VVAPGYAATPDDDGPSAYHPGRRSRQYHTERAYSPAQQRRGRRSRGRRATEHRRQRDAQQRRFHLYTYVSEDGPPDWWIDNVGALKARGWEVGEIRSRVRGADNKAKYLVSPRCRLPGQAWYYPESEGDIAWILRYALVRKATP
jgi:hypothetical protein